MSYKTFNLLIMRGFQCLPNAKPGIRNAFLTMPGNWAHTLYVLIKAPEDIFSVGFVS